jgi:outer membrane biosynthesis protein TonB
VDVVALTSDPGLYEAIREAVGERNPVWRARSAEDAVDLLLTGRCGVLLIDLAAVSTRPETLIQQITDQFPDVVVCVAGVRDDEAPLAPLIGEGLVYRFLHKPLTPRRAGMFLQAAIRRYCDRREDVQTSEPMLRLVNSLPRRFEPMKWGFVAAGLALFVVALNWTFGSHAPPAGDAATAAAAASAAPPTPPAIVPRADPILSSARAALDAGRYEAPAGRNALDLYRAVLLASPGSAEARQGLDRTVTKIMEQAIAAADAGQPAEALRLADRVLAADPGRRSAQSLVKRLRPAPAPANANVAAPGPQPPAAALPEVAISPAPPSAAAAPAAAAPARPAPGTVAVQPQAVRPDPLAPRYSNASASAPASTKGRTRVYGAPINTGLPTAGYATPSAVTELSSATPASPSKAESVQALSRLPVDALERVLVVDPVYPPQALRNHTNGWVELEFTITESGFVRDVQVVESRPRSASGGSGRASSTASRSPSALRSRCASTSTADPAALSSTQPGRAASPAGRPPPGPLQSAALPAFLPHPWTRRARARPAAGRAIPGTTAAGPAGRRAPRTRRACGCERAPRRANRGCARIDGRPRSRARACRRPGSP